jgi:hypothetical protein
MDDRHCRCIPKASQKHKFKKQKTNANNNSPGASSSSSRSTVPQHACLYTVLETTVALRRDKGEVCLSRDS